MSGFSSHPCTYAESPRKVRPGRNRWARQKGIALVEAPSRYLGPRGPGDVCCRRRGPRRRRRAQSQPCPPPCQATFRGHRGKIRACRWSSIVHHSDSDRSVFAYTPPPPLSCQIPNFSSARSIPAPARPGNTRVAEVCGRALRGTATRQKAIAALMRLRESPTSMPCMAWHGQCMSARHLSISGSAPLRSRRYRHRPTTPQGCAVKGNAASQRSANGICQQAQEPGSLSQGFRRVEHGLGTHIVRSTKQTSRCGAHCPPEGRLFQPVT